MKKFIALFLALSLSAAVFASCNNGDSTSGTSASTDTSASTSASDTSASTSGTVSDTTASSTTSTTTQTTTTFVSLDNDAFKSINHDYSVRFVREQIGTREETVYDSYAQEDVTVEVPVYGDVIGVAVYTWPYQNATKDIVFEENYVMENGTTYTLVQVGVGQGILSFNNQLESVTIPASVTMIANKAFSACTKLTTVNLAEGLESIGVQAFWNCTSLESIEIPSTVTEIGRNAFAGCKNLKSVTLPRVFEDQLDTIFGVNRSADMVITYID